MNRFAILIASCFLLFQEGVQAGDYFPPGRGRRDFLGMNMPMMGNRWPFKEGSLWVGLQSARAYIVYPRFGSHTGVPLQIQGDYSFDNHWSFGLYAGRFSGTYTDVYGSESYQSQIRSFSGGIRLTLHFADVFNNTFGEVANVKKWDFYSTAFMGWYSYRWEVDPKYSGQQDFSDASFGSMGCVLGVAWLPVPRFRIFVEGGKGTIGYLGFGISAKVKK